MRQLKQKYRGVVWDLRVGTHIVIGEKLPERIWQFQKLLWNHERRGFTDTKYKFGTFTILSIMPCLYNESKTVFGIAQFHQEAVKKKTLLSKHSVLKCTINNVTMY